MVEEERDKAEQGRLCVSFRRENVAFPSGFTYRRRSRSEGPARRYFPRSSIEDRPVRALHRVSYFA